LILLAAKLPRKSGRKRNRWLKLRFKRRRKRRKSLRLKKQKLNLA